MSLTVRLDQLIAFMARHAVFLSLLHESNTLLADSLRSFLDKYESNKKKAYFHKHFEVFFSIADSYDCVKNFTQVSVQMHKY